MKKSFVYIICVVLLAPIAFLLWQNVESVMGPVEFNNEYARREAVAKQILIDIKDLQEAYRGETGRYLSTIDSLQAFYKEGKMKYEITVGSKDDSAAVANTEKVISKIKKASRKKLSDADINQALYKEYKKGNTSLVFSVPRDTLVNKVLFVDRPDFDIEKIAYIPYSDGKKVCMETVIKDVAGGLKVPLFEAYMPLDDLLKGLDRQLIINMKAERKELEKYEVFGGYKGIQIGSVSNANNNAGNWE